MTALLIAAIFLVSFVLTMVRPGGGLVFTLLFLILGFAKAEAASASLFLNKETNFDWVYNLFGGD
jgi:hypothetical protein